ncbi:MAG: 50S ribosomal protein L4 [Actinomycetota bacterium]
MSEVQLYSRAGEAIGNIALDESVFGAQVNVPVMHQVVVAQLAAARSGTHSTKRRGEVSGGGRKPWKQKGTGRARQGSTRAPHWSGGGVAMGPKPRDHEVKVPKKMKALALRSALSDRAKDGKVAVIEEIGFETPRTKDAVALLKGVGADGNVLVVLDTATEQTVKAFRNLTKVHLLLADQINTYDVLNSDWVVFTKPALEQVTQKRKAAPSRSEKARSEKAGVAQ